MLENALAVVVGKNIAERRKMLAFTQKELAVKLDITPDAMVRIEKGRIGPKMSRLPEIAEQLQCSVPYLFRGHNEETDDRAAHIAEILRPLPPSVQDALLELIVQTVHIVGK